MSDIEAIIVIVIVACVGKYILKGVFGFHSRSRQIMIRITSNTVILLHVI